MHEGTCIRAYASRRVYRRHMHQGVCVRASIEGECIEVCSRRNNVIRHCFHGGLSQTLGVGECRVP
jgi:hypothetical protein